ncbi:MAG TPA: thioredoxin domain-containing protein [Pyrinomonadaceae bacterium]|jgi:protein-disulfide isomerase
MKRFIYLLFMLAAASGPIAAQSGASQTNAPAAARAAVKPAHELKGAHPSVVARSTVAAVEENCGCEDIRLPEVLAVVNGVKITRKDISPQTQARVVELQRQVIEARRRELDLQINSLLLEAEAKKRGVSTTKIIEEEIIAKTQEPTETEALAFFNQNKALIEKQAGAAVEFKQIKDNIVAHLRAERRQGLAKKLSERLRASADVKVLVQEATPPADPSDRARLFATVNGQRILSGDIEDSLHTLVYGVQEEVYRLRQRDLELKINDILLAQEAQRRQVTTRALLDSEVDSKATPVTEAQALEFYNQNKERIKGDFAQLKGEIVRYLQDTEGRKLLVAFAETLRKGASLQTFLAAPKPPVFDVATDDQPAKGGAEAQVTIVEFTDFQCPSCAQIQPVLDRLVGEYSGRVRLVARDYPLPQHADAFKAAEAAEAAREQGKYWEYAAKLFGNQSALGVDRLKQYATELGLDRAKFDAALDGERFSGHVRRDLIDGDRVGVNGTPSLFINGRRVSDRSYEGLKAEIEAALSVTARK